MFLNFNTKKRTVDLHTAMWEISGIVYPHFYARNENAPPALTGEGAGNGMTEAMPFLQKCDIIFLRAPDIARGLFSFCY